MLQILGEDTTRTACEVADFCTRRERLALEVQIQEFGQTPRQIFSDPHPQKFLKQEENSGEIPKLRSKIRSKENLKETSKERSSAKEERSSDRLVYSPHAISQSTKSLSVEDPEVSSLHSIVPAASNEEEDIVPLGEDFQMEVERVLQKESENISNSFVEEHNYEVR